MDQPANEPPNRSNRLDQNTVRLIAANEASKIIGTHLHLCPFAQLDIEPRIRTIEQRFCLLLGALLGSGIIGGATGATIAQWLN